MMMNIGTFIPEPLVNSVVYEESDDDIEVTLDKEQFLSDHYIAQVTPPAYTPSLPFLTTMEPADTLLMGDEVISTTPARENDKFIKSSIDGLVPILRESEVTSDSNLECDMLVNTPLPTTDVREENFDINSPLGEYVVDFLMENEDIADLPRHLVKQLFSYLVKHPSSTKRMSDEPLGDDSKPRSYDVTFSNSLFDFNDDYTLYNDNPLFDEEFEDISSLDPHKSSPRPAAYSLKEVMYRYYHLHLTLSDGFDYEIKKIPSDESKVHIEVLSVLWGNRLPIPDGSLPLSRYKGLKTKQKR
ncbi:hypothetical protein Tco_1277621 [Tanacetum coccineum]